VITRLLLKIILKSLRGRSCDILIDVDYMERWYLIPRNRFFNVYFHRFIGSDAPTPHDHPWVSMSYILQGQYIEHTPKGEFIRKTGQVKFRAAKAFHWIEIDKPVLTLFITGPRIRMWGFQCSNGWVDFRKYIDRRGDNRLASGCGEYE